MIQAVILFVHAAIGWALCGATIAVGRRITTMDRALIAHALAAPAIFAVVAVVDFAWFGVGGAVSTAIAFVAIVVILDVLVVALMIEKSFAMFRSFLGTWLPFILIFLAVWLTGLAMGLPS